MGTVTNRPPRKLGNFEIVQEIGQGGMGVVYLARQPALNRHVVLKKIRRELLADPDIVERFQREARAAAAVHHQNVVTVYHCFTSRNDHYIAQELVHGVDLRTVLAQVGRVEPRVAALIGLEVVRGLEEIHARGIVHRDLKPGNILIGRGGETKIADFGIAFEVTSEELTRPGTMLGSPRYMSPEQMLGERIDHRSDLFSLGILLYEMITGETPFQESEGDATEPMLERMQKESYLRPGKHGVRIPLYLSRLIRSCLRGRPSARIQTATEIRRMLERRLRAVSPADCRGRIAEFLWSAGILRQNDDETERRHAETGGRLHDGRRRWLLPAIAAAVLALFGLAHYAVRQSSESASEAIPVERARAVPPTRPGQFAGRDSRTESASLGREISGEAFLTAARGEQPGGSTEADDVGSNGSEDVPRPGIDVAADVATPAPPAEDPARVRFVVRPWAEVRLDDGTVFVTPRAEPVSLDPGRHSIVLEHPVFGKSELTVELDAGEDRVIRHDFEAAKNP